MKSLFFKSFDGSKICYQYTKKGKKCLIFVHGLGGDLTAWHPEREYFNSLGYSTVAIDLRGHGLSQRSNDPSFYELENFTKDILSLIKFLKLEKPVLIGHCFGGIVSMLFCAKYQDLLTSLILIDSSYKPPAFLGTNDVEHALLGKLFGFLAKVMPDVRINGHVDFTKFKGTEDIDLRRFTSDVLHTSLRGYLLMCQKLSGYDGKSLLSKIKLPVLVLEGLDDTIFPPEIAEYLADRIKRSELEFVHDANHILVINNTEEVNNSIKLFLNRIKYNSHE